MKTAVRDLRELLSSRPDAADYRAVLQSCPERVENESNLERYLNAFELNVSKCAKKIAKYWRYRRELFGDDRYMHPLQLSSPSCLEDSHIEMVGKAEKEELKVGAGYLLLPNKKGQTVFYFTRGRATPNHRVEMLNASIEDRKKCGFWFMHQISLQKNSECVLVTTILEKSPYHSPSIASFFSDMCQTVFPVNLRALHLVIASRTSRKRFVVQTFMPYFLKILRGPFSFTHRTIDVVFEDTRKEEEAAMARILIEKYGIHPKSMPKSLGGTWSYQRAMAYFESGQQDTTALELLAEAAANQQPAPDRKPGATPSLL